MKMEDDFEYHLVFPNPKESDCENKKLETSDTRRQNLKDPVVILLGWAGCKDNHLAKYSAIHEDDGCAVVRYTAPAKMLFNPTEIKKVTIHAEKLVNLLYDYDLNSHPLIIHVFSNGGACVFDQMTKVLDKEEHKGIKVKGCIFDSSPAHMTPLRTFRALWHIVPGNYLIRLVYSLATTAYVWSSWFFNRIIHFFTGRIDSPHRWDVYMRLAARPALCPELFLYSKADTVTSYQSISNFVGERKSRGVAVRSLVFEDSPHVGHLIHHRDSYIESVQRFVKDCTALESS